MSTSDHPNYILPAGERYYGILVGAKGDLKHQVEVGNLERSYHTLGNDQEMCSLCLAGTNDIPFTDTNDEPLWATTLYVSRPWTTTPCLAAVPYITETPEKVFHLDPFHLFKVGLGRDLSGSTIVILARLGFWDSDGDSKAMGVRLQRAHSMFSLWCSSERRAPGLRSFKVGFMNIKNKSSFAWCSSKGSDTMLLLKFLHWYVSLQLVNPSDISKQHEDFLKVLKHTIESGLAVFKIMHSHGLWMPRDCSKLLYTRLMLLLRGYKQLARHAMGLKQSGFGLKPKFHGMHHVAYSIRYDLVHHKAELVLNPLISACEQNEDTVGRISRLSRKLATKTLTQRLFQRHFLKKGALLRRSRPSRKNKWSNWTNRFFSFDGKPL